ncbi:MAG: hypothetical protein SGPRY_011858, partial [Prymnesium sp.]
EVLRSDLDEMVKTGHMRREVADACLASTNRPLFCLNAMTAVVREAGLEPWHHQRMDATISTLVDLTGANERIFKSPVPLVYTRHLARFLTVFLCLLPFGLWPDMGSSWNRILTIPATTAISFFLFGIEEIGIQIEEPFSLLPIEDFCNLSIGNVMGEILKFGETTRGPSAA